ncbi:MAG: NTP transferase domain-containing protein [Planctomycetes bacterium]|nr:NTP transferase domain-containing protein [Planctomycetota bacterium]
MMPTIAILCGGLATRLRPVTETLPKSLLPVLGEPFILRQLRLLHRCGLREAVLCIGKMGEMIQECVGDGEAVGLRVRYSSDGERQLGTAGALKKALPLLGEAFFVLYGDSYLECDYQAVADGFADAEAGADGLMTVYRNENRFDTSNVLFRDGRILAYDKAHPTPDMRHIDWGLGLLRAAALRDIPDGEPADLADTYARLAADNRLAGYEMPNRFFEIGSWQGVADLEAHLGGVADVP